MTEPLLDRSPIAIVGMGGLFPSPDGTASCEQLWQQVLHGIDAARPVPPGRWLLDPDDVFDPGIAVADRTYSRHGCFLGPFTVDPAGLDLPADLLAQLDPVYHLALHAGREAFRSARTESLDRGKVGVILGCIALPTEKVSALAREILGHVGEPAALAAGFGAPNPAANAAGSPTHPLNRSVVGLPAALLARALHLGGPCFTLDAACASSLYALHLACEELRTGRADAMLAGGLSRPDCLYTQMGFAQLRALSTTGHCHPFDARASGLVVGEGAGIFVLKRLNDALSAGDRILALIESVGVSNDRSGNLLAPSSEGQLRAMRSAYDQAGWSPLDIDLIECHATGTPVGDLVEYQSLRTLWGQASRERQLPEPRGKCVLGSVKSTVGHLLTGAAAAGLVKVLGALRDKRLPPTANFAAPAPGVDLESSPFRILTAAEPWPERADGAPRRAAISAFGFGGINAHLLLEEFVGWVERSETHHAPRVGRAQRDPPYKRNEAPVAIVGLDAHFGPWSTLETVSQRLLGGRATDAPRPPRNWSVPECACAGFYLEDLQVSLEQFRIPPRELAEMLPQQVLMLQVAARALQSAVLPDAVRERTGVYIGVALDLNTTNFTFRWSLRDPAQREAAGPALNANRTMGALASIAASRIAREFQLGGPSFTLSSEETSGLHAVDMAVRALQRGEIDLALVGAVDLAGDVRNVVARQRGPDQPAGYAPVGEGAAAIVLKRLADAERDGNPIHALITEIGPSGSPSLLVDGAATEADLGQCGAATGLASLVKACLCLEQQVLPPLGLKPAQHWLHDRSEGPRRAEVRSRSCIGTFSQMMLEEHAGKKSTAGPAPSFQSETLFVVAGDDASDLVRELTRLQGQLEHDQPLDDLARRFHAATEHRRGALLAVALVARNGAELRELLSQARHALTTAPGRALPDPAGPPTAGRDRIFYSPAPLGMEGLVAFVFPGSGNDFPGMGRDLALAWPDVLRRQHSENRRLRSQYLPEAYWQPSAQPVSHRQKIFAQVALGTLVSDLLRTLGVQPAAAIGYSLGESAALFALRAWTDRDGMLADMNASPLFASDLVGRYDAARTAWALPAGVAVEWSAGIVERSADQVRQALQGEGQAYLLIINTPRECVIGGDRQAVQRTVQRLGCRLLPLQDTSSVHCRVAHIVAEAYRTLHLRPTTPPRGVRIYSSALGRAYEVDQETAADAILAQALDTLDFPTVINNAYQDGVRLFVEVGPGASCSRMISTILGDRPHRARSACPAGGDAVSSVLRLLAQLAAERVPLKLDALSGLESENPNAPGKERTITLPIGGQALRVPRSIGGSPVKHTGEPRMLRAELEEARSVGRVLQQTVEVETARSQAHEVFLRFSQGTQQVMARTLAFQTSLLERLPAAPVLDAPVLPLRSMDREQCLEFAIGSIGRVLGPDYAAIDRFPTRVRLPDEPLMLVDRIVQIEGEPLSLTSGRVITEHDIHPGAWYLDHGRIPTCIAVEAGQADLFLSGFLGIDLKTHGLAVYRLLDAIVTFHSGLPQPGQTIRYDIRIDRFFRQGETYLFRFRFEGTVAGRPLLTMTDGCAGFFTSDDLASGKGVVQTELDRRPRPGIQPDDQADLPPCQVESYSEEQIDALRRGDLAAAFGPLFAGLPLRDPVRLPGERMRLVHRVTRLDPTGGRYGIGQIRAEADIHPDDWFLTCHFVDDQVMPGTLMYECCLHTLRILLLRLGWVGERSEVVFEPVPGVASQLKCRGQVTAQTRTVTYEVTLKERGYRPEPYAIADALMYADGKPIVEMRDLCLRLTGLTRERVRQVWRNASAARPVLFGPESILAFSNGNPSEAFGDRYRIFDRDRFIARLPGPPYQFLDRIVHIEAQPWKMVAGGVVEAEYDVSPEAWYFAAERQPVMPFAVLLEIPLQVCGWLAAYMGSALTSKEDLCFRNLEGNGELLCPVGPDAGTLTSRICCTRIASSAGMIIQHYDFEVRSTRGPVYRGNTVFGFFTRSALAQQVGIRDAQLYQPSTGELARSRSFAYPDCPTLPDDRLRMIDQVDVLLLDGGPNGLGLVRGSKRVRPEEWFFKAHFYLDPVIPGSLGLESLLQLLKVYALERWGRGEQARLAMPPGKHRWVYRGQVIPSHRQVQVQAEVNACDDRRREVTTKGYFLVDGRVIYQMEDFTLTFSPDVPLGAD
jgi:acyl transferase domain-containing protein/3-hydroxymyristoyl/3-hydroxydecanoyl-(acyl carrier protein) dehydratase